jgi:hypothetical protein
MLTKLAKNNQTIGENSSSLVTLTIAMQKEDTFAALNVNR